MTTLRIEPLEMPAAELGPENPLPRFRGEDDDREVKAGADVPEEDRRYFGWRIGDRVLPHRMQDSYNRVKRPRVFRVAVLENEFLRATFAPELGGRMLSLVHKPLDRELLDRNPVFQPANLALRDAWFSGGVEWNTAQLGHYYLTCSPVFAARVEGPDGAPVLRLYEWDRVKRFPWQIDFHLPPGSRFLFARVRLVNPHDEELPMYWWSNIAVRERPEARTLCPADQILSHRPGSEEIGLLQAPAPYGYDGSYSTNAPGAGEWFFRIPNGQRPWIAHLDRSGKGLVHASTDRLRGRKMFFWGMSRGGRRWQEFLAAPGSAYIEIQAGLARTQLESLPMPARAEWTWTEAYGLLEAGPAAVHGQDWGRAWHEADAALEQVLPRARVEQLDREWAADAARPPRELLGRGSGWGALERRRVARQKERDGVPAEAVFPDETLGPEQAPWLALLEKGALPERGVQEEPGAWMVQGAWRRLLEDALQAGRGDHWLSWLHLGVMRLEDREAERAREAFERSLKHRRSAWALRNLAVMEHRAGRNEAALARLEEAWAAGPHVAPLAVELGRALVELKRFEAFRTFHASLPPHVRGHERLRMMAVQAHLHFGEFEAAEALLNYEFANVREGEVNLKGLWFEAQAQRAAKAEGVPLTDELRRRVRRTCVPPVGLDFQMHGEQP
jgi:tetratricopeptide (TPR) repeat protein